MSNAPVYDLQGGGRLFWHVESVTSAGVTITDYTGQLASISGLSKRVDYNGGLYFNAATIQIAGGGLLNGDGVGSLLNISLRDVSNNILAGWGVWTITATETTGKSVKITAEPIKKSQIPEDFNWYEYRPWQPRRYAQYWLDNAMQGADTVASIPFHASLYPRADAKVVAPASVFKGCSGLRGPQNSTTATTVLQLGTNEAESTWTDPTRTTQLLPALDAEFDFAPKAGVLLGSTPLYWHYIGSGRGYFVANIIARDTNVGQTPSSLCQYPLGIMQYLKLTMQWVGSSTVTLPANNYQTQPSETKEVTLSFPTRAEAKQYLAESAKYRPSATPMSPFGKSTRQGITADGGVLRRNVKGGGKTVSILNYAIYNGVAAKFYEHARSVLAPSATKPSGAAPGESVDLDIVFSTSAGLVFPTPAGMMAAVVHFLPIEANSDWAALGLSGIGSFRPGYRWQQTLYPVTIAQDYTTREHFAEACMVGHIGFFQNASGLVGAELCSEQGTVYALALTISTAVGVEVGPQYAPPKDLWINFRDQYAVNRSYHWPDNYNWLAGCTGEAMTLNLCAGVIQPCNVTRSGTSDYISLHGNQWVSQPGCMAVRLHGSDWNSSGISVLSCSADPKVTGLLGDNDHLYQQDSPNYGTLTKITSYGIRTKDGVVWQAFVGNTQLRLKQYASQQSDFAAEPGPLVDVYGVNVWAEAHNRIYSDNLNRQAYIVQTTMAFCSAEPGDVVAVRLPQIFDGAELLAAVLAVEVDSGGVCKLEIVPMHKISSADYNAYTNLAQVLP